MVAMLHSLRAFSHVLRRPPRSSTLGLTSVASGVQQWHVELSSLAGDISVGVAPESVDLALDVRDLPETEAHYVNSRGETSRCAARENLLD